MGLLLLLLLVPVLLGLLELLRDPLLVLFEFARVAAQGVLANMPSAQRIAEYRVATRWSQIEEVAQTLMDRETLDERECRRVLESASNLR